MRLSLLIAVIFILSFNVLAGITVMSAWVMVEVVIGAIKVLRLKW